jgi:lysyl endopeptidase
LIRVGNVIDVQSPQRSVVWRSLPDGSAVAHLQVHSGGAIGLRARIEVPPGMTVRELRATSAAGKVESVVYKNSAQELWTPYTDGETQTIEVEIAPAHGARGNTLDVTSVMHFDRSPHDAVPTSIAKDVSGSCNPDIACTTNNTALDAAMALRKRSVAHISFRSGGNTFICTATLINSEKFPRPFLLTADHCISSAAEAASLTTFWFKENAGCGQPNTANTTVQVGGGAQLLLTNTMVDSTLLEMNNMPPAGAEYSGWNAAPLNVNDAIVSISHPRGDPMKFALGTYSGLVPIVDAPYRMYGVRYTRGVIEGGSSGSGLFTLSPTQGLQLRGVLSGATTGNGGLSCTNTNERGVYGRFEVFYPNIQRIISNNAPAADADSETIVGTRDLPLGGSLLANIDRPGDLDFFRILVPQSGTLSVRSTGGNDLVAALLNAEGGRLATNDDAELSSTEFGMTFRVDPGTYYLNVGHFEPGSIGAYQVSSSFSTATQNYSDIWYTTGEDGWGIQINHQGNILFAAVYTYDVDGTGLWLIMSRGDLQPDGSYLGGFYRVTGPPFNAQPWVGAVTPTQVGTMRLRFTGANSGQLTYSVNGITVNKTLSRLRFSTPTTCSFSAFDRSYATNVSDLWYKVGEEGWGLNFIQQGDILFVTMYTYDETGKPMWLIMSRGDKQAGTSTFTGDLYRVRGPRFDTVPWQTSAVVLTKVGTMTAAFTDGNNGTLTYSVNGAQVVKPIQRFVYASPMPECEDED